MAAHLAIAWLGAGKTVAIVDIDLHAYTEARFAVWAADLVIIPVEPSPMDIWAIQATIVLAKAEQIKTFVVLNRIPARAGLTEVLRDAIKRFEVALAKT